MSETLTPENAALALSLNMDPETGLALDDSTRTRLQALVDSAQAPAVGSAAAEQDVLASLTGTTSVGEVDGSVGAGSVPYGNPDEHSVGQHFVEQRTASGDDLVQAQLDEIKAALGALTGGHPVAQQQMTFDDVLTQIDPRDSEAALAMFQWLVDNGRLSRIGMLDGGGYLLHYSEPKGTTKAGYTPGATKGGRMVDAAVAKAKESGATKRQQSMCPKCFSVVTKAADGTVVLDGDNPDPTCAAGGAHVWGE